MGWPRDEIADWFGRPWPKEDGTAGRDLLGDFFRILHVDFKMFRCVEIGEFGRLFARFRFNQEDTVIENFLDAFRAGELGGLFGNFRLDFGSLGKSSSNAKSDLSLTVLSGMMRCMRFI